VNDGPVPLVPAGSSPLRELARAVDETLRLPEPWPRDVDEEIFLRLSRDRADIVGQAMRRIISQPGDDPGELIATTAWLREQAATLPAHIYKQAGKLT
jgi:hypothetical protein